VEAVPEIGVVVLVGFGVDDDGMMDASLWKGNLAGSQRWIWVSMMGASETAARARSCRRVMRIP
jgi:hypothetical protein